jgi:hypothetical protein
MTTVEVLGLLLALLVMGVGVAGSVLPAIPSTPLIVIAAVAHRLYFGAESASNLALGLMIGLMLFSLLLDYLASMIGARKLGATWRGVVGAVVGGLIGLFFSLPGIIIGSFLGAGLFEMMGGRPWPEATRAGFGAVLGLVFGAVGKIACCIAMIVLFTFSVVMRANEEPESGDPSVASAPLIRTHFRTHLPGPIAQGLALADVGDPGFSGDIEEPRQHRFAVVALHAVGRQLHVPHRQPRHLNSEPDRGVLGQSFGLTQQTFARLDDGIGEVGRGGRVEDVGVTILPSDRFVHCVEPGPDLRRGVPVISAREFVDVPLDIGGRVPQ